MKMKRNLVAVAVTSAVSTMLVTPAMADVTVYGRAQVEIASYTYDKNYTSPGVSPDDGITMKDESQGQVGVKASEDLGNGWTGLAKFEFKTDTVDNETSSGVSLAPREAFVGLKGEGVQIELGTTKQAYKYAGGVNYDPFVATTLEARGNEGMTGKLGDLAKAAFDTCKSCGVANDFGHASFLDNSIAIEGGSGPIKARLNYGPNVNDGAWMLSVTFTQDNFQVGVAADDTGDKMGDGTIGTVTDKVKGNMNKLFGQFKMGPHTISAQYEDGKLDGGDNGEQKITVMYLDYNMKMGNNLIDLAYGQTDYDCSVDGCNPTFTRIAVRHSMSKTSSLFAGYRKTDADGAETRESVISVGLRQDF